MTEGQKELAYVQIMMAMLLSEKEKLNTIIEQRRQEVDSWRTRYVDL